VRKADPARHCPIEHRRDHRARLTEESDFPRRGCQVGEGGVEPEARHHDADAVRPDDPQEMRLCRLECRPLQAAALLAELAKTGGNDDGSASAELTQLANEAGYCLGGRDDDREIRGVRQARDIRVDAQPVDRLVMRVDEHQLAAKSGAAQVARNDPTDRVGPWTCADHRHRSRLEQLVEIANRHRSPANFSSLDAQCRSLLGRNGGPTIGELVDPVGDQIVLHLCQTEVPKVVDQIAPWIVQPAGAGDERDDPTHFELVGMDHPTADEQCRYNLKMAAKAA